MDTNTHPYRQLFDQLGLDSSSQAIEKFIESNRPLPGKTELYQAEFWNASQAAFLEQAKSEDAEWAEIVDQLDASLR